MAYEAFCTKLGIDLIQAAKNELDFLQLADECPNLLTGPVIKNAIRRYEVLWLPLVSKEAATSKFLAAPLDIAWVWHAHMLAPYYYEHDCTSIVSQIVDHVPLNAEQRNEGLQRARYLWEIAYPGEPFEIHLNQYPSQVYNYNSKIRYDLEKACTRQSKFYYQVSLPHFRDNKFLKKAVQRYENHLELKRKNPQLFIVPCYDFDLIWHAHQLHPVKYNRTTTELLGEVLHHDDTVTGRTPGSTLYDSEVETRAAWKAAGQNFSQSGAMYRGDPPGPRPPRQPWHYASLGRFEYFVDLLRVEVLNVDARKTFVIRLQDAGGNLLLSQSLKSGGVYEIQNRFKVNNETNHNITVFLYQKSLLLGEKNVGSAVVNLLFCLDPIPLGGTVPLQPIILDVPLAGGQAVARLTIRLNPPTVEGYRFTMAPITSLTKFAHPSMIFSWPQTMFMPIDLAKPSLPCESSTHTLFDCRGREAFRCRVAHSSLAVLSAVEIISLHNTVVASAHTINSNTLPEKKYIQDDKRSVSLNQVDGERAMLIRGRNDWGVCVGKWKKPRMFGFGGPARYVRITFFKLYGERCWCDVRRYKGGLYLIYLEPNIFAYLDLKRSIIIISPLAQDIPEIIALAFSVSILYILCKPYKPRRSMESVPSLHKKAKDDKVSTMLDAAGYKSTEVPTNVFLKSTKGREACAACGASLGSDCYDLDNESGPEWTGGFRRHRRGVAIGTNVGQVCINMGGARPPPPKPRKPSSPKRRSGGFGAGGHGGGCGGGDGGGGGGGGGC